MLQGVPHGLSGTSGGLRGALRDLMGLQGIFDVLQGASGAFQEVTRAVQGVSVGSHVVKSV